MASIYDKIKTAKELLTEVQIHGLSTKVEDICRAQDIIGRTSVEELDILANDNGMDGNMSTGRRGTQAVFYQVLFRIWNWEDATRFYNQHSNKEYIELVKKRDELKTAKSELEDVTKQLKEEHESVLNERSRAIHSEEHAKRVETRLHERDMTIIELKAKLYDLMIQSSTEEE